MLQAIRTAKSWGKEPVRMILGSFHDMDEQIVEYLNNMLMVAYQIIEDETCSSCGVVHWLGKSTINTIEFDVEETTCYSCAELEQARERDNKKDKKEYGVTKYVTPKSVLEDTPLPTRSESYEKMR